MLIYPLLGSNHESDPAFRYFGYFGARLLSKCQLLDGGHAGTFCRSAHGARLFSISDQLAVFVHFDLENDTSCFIIRDIWFGNVIPLPSVEVKSCSSIASAGFAFVYGCAFGASWYALVAFFTNIITLVSGSGSSRISLYGKAFSEYLSLSGEVGYESRYTHFYGYVPGTDVSEKDIPPFTATLLPIRV